MTAKIKKGNAMLLDVSLYCMKRYIIPAIIFWQEECVAVMKIRKY